LTRFSKSFGAGTAAAVVNTNILAGALHVRVDDHSRMAFTQSSPIKRPIPPSLSQEAVDFFACHASASRPAHRQWQQLSFYRFRRLFEMMKHRDSSLHRKPMAKPNASSRPLCASGLWHHWPDSEQRN